MNTQMGQSTVGEMLPYLIVLGVCLLLIIFCIKMAITTSKAQKKQKAVAAQKKENGATVTVNCPHVSGLPIAENILCTITSYPDKLVIDANHNQFNLEKSKITDICIKTDTEIHQQYISSIGGAVGGAILFGPLGAVIGGRAKNKKVKKTTQYLIITYKKNDDLQYIGFEVINSFQAVKLVGEFMKERQGQTNVVEL